MKCLRIENNIVYIRFQTVIEFELS